MIYNVEEPSEVYAKPRVCRSAVACYNRGNAACPDACQRFAEHHCYGPGGGFVRRRSGNACLCSFHQTQKSCFSRLVLFAFISPLIGAAGCGFLGSIIGTAFAAAVYVIIAIVIKLIGTGWVDKLLPPVIIGPTVALIGLSLCGSAVNNLNNTAAGDYNLVAILCGIITFAVTVIASARGNKTTKLIPFYYRYTLRLCCGVRFHGDWQYYRQ